MSSDSESDHGLDITFEIYTDEEETESNNTDNGSTETYSETDSYSPSYASSLETDHSFSPNENELLLSIDGAIALRPILDSTISEDEVIAKEENECEPEITECKSDKSQKTRLKKKKLSWKSKPIKGVKVWNGFTKLLSLFATNNSVKEKQIKKICHLEITELVSQKKSKHCSIIKNFEIVDNICLCEIAKKLFDDSSHSNDRNKEHYFDIWNIGLIMLFMILGKDAIIENITKFEHLNDLQTLLWDLYCKKQISTNLFDLLYFFIFVENDQTNESNPESKYNQITQHLFFHKKT